MLIYTVQFLIILEKRYRVTRTLCRWSS